MPAWMNHLLDLLSLPEYGLSSVFVISFVSATLLPLGSEPAVFGDWWLGYGAHKVADKYGKSKTHLKAIDWLGRIGPKACLFSFLPIIGDPLCAVAGWLKLPFWPCVGWMLAGKFLRYFAMTAALVGMFPGVVVR